jgi:hypothetical protein
MATPKFAATTQSFHTELKRRINTYFAEGEKSFTGGTRIYTKALILFATFVGLYVHLVFLRCPCGWRLPNAFCWVLPLRLSVLILCTMVATARLAKNNG